jgi:hypothetical protein
MYEFLTALFALGFAITGFALLTCLPVLQTDRMEGDSIPDQWFAMGVVRSYTGIHAHPYWLLKLPSYSMRESFWTQDYRWHQLAVYSFNGRIRLIHMEEPLLA